MTVYNFFGILKNVFQRNKLIETEEINRLYYEANERTLKSSAETSMNKIKNQNIKIKKINGGDSIFKKFAKLYKILIGKFIDIICFVGGAFITSYYIFGFEKSIPQYYGYYYKVESRIGIAIGTTLIVLGMLKNHWKSIKSSQHK